MENRKVVVALGRNAFSESFPKQQERVKLAAKAIADLVEEKYEVIITHSNGQNCCTYVYMWCHESGIHRI